jgi:hypothetical protein
MRFGLLPAATLALFLAAFLANDFARADIAFLGANEETSNHFAFVALGNYAPGTVINFIDSNYGSDGAGESTKFRWSEQLISGAPLSLTLSTGLTLGQVVIFDAAEGRFERPGNVAFGTTAGAAMAFHRLGDNIFAYRGTVTEEASAELYRGNTSGVTSFEGAFQWGTGGSWLTSGMGNTVESYLPTTPNTPFNFSYATTLDNVLYNGPRTFGSLADMQTALANAANWTGHTSTTTSPAGFGGDFVVAVPEASAAAFGGLAGLAAAIGPLWRRRRSGRLRSGRKPA